MSGTKVMAVRLDARRRQEVAAEVEKSRRQAALLAETANLEGRLASVHDAIERLLSNAATTPAFRTRLESFRERSGAFAAAGDELRGMFDEILRATSGTPDEAVLARVVALRARADALLTARRTTARPLEAELADVEAGLEPEAQRLAFEDARAERRQRRALAGLHAEWRSRMHPAASCSLAAVPGAQELGTRIEELLDRDAALLDTDVASCRQQMDALAAAAESRQREQEERRATFDGLHGALREVGYVLVAPPAFGQETIVARHAINEPTVRGLVDSAVEGGGRIRLEFSGPSGDGIVLLGPSDHCHGQLRDLAVLARRYGVVIERALWKGPDGWHALDLPREEPAPAPAVGHHRTLETEP